MAGDCFREEKWLYGYCAKLADVLAVRDGILPVTAAADLAARLVDGHTYLLVDDGTGAELVRAEAFGNQVKITRGLGGTAARAFPAGSCVKWTVTEEAVKAAACAADCREDEPSCMPSADVPEKCAVRIWNADGSRLVLAL